MDLNLPSATETLPQEYGRGYLSNLDSLLQKSQQSQYGRSRLDLQNAGLLNSRDEFTPAAEQVLPSNEQQRNSIEMPEIQNAYGVGRSERLASIAFQHQRDFADSEFQRRLQELQAEANARQSLLEYKKSLQDDGGGLFGGSLPDFGGAGYAIPFYNATLVGSKLLGTRGGLQAAGTAAGAYAGGPIGAAAGGSVGGSIYDGAKRR